MTLSNNLPKAEQLVTVIVNRGRSNELHFSAIVSEYLDDQRLVVVLPKQVDDVRLDQLFPVELEYGSDAALYKYPTKISELHLSQDKTKKLCSFFIDPDLEPEKIQRRSFFRLYERFELYIKKINLPDPFEVAADLRRAKIVEWQKDRAAPVYEVMSHNIGGGGLSFEFHIEACVGDSYLMEFKLNNEHFVIPGRVTYSKRDGLDSEIYLTGINFVGITEREQDKIIEYVFNKQSEKLRNRS